jgi:peptidoglycan hydrolase-like protein with peptidoglycan-binding domain
MGIFSKPFLVGGVIWAFAASASTAYADVWTFETPSENVQCTVGEAGGESAGVLSDISCTIIERSGPPALPRPPSCTSGWGHVFSMRERGPVTMECGHPSQDKSGFHTADYGVTGEFAGFTCHSSTKGLKCTNRDGNGFFLSRRKQTLLGSPQNLAARSPVASNKTAATSGHRFADHPPTASLNSAAKFPDFGGRDRKFREYRTRIRNGISEGVNFAGHYSFITIGCGTECQFGYVVDLRTGEVFDFPYGGEEQYQMGLLFTPESRLVKVRWKGSWESETCTEKDLLVDGTKWHILAERTVPTDDGLCFYDPDVPLEQYGTSTGPAEPAATNALDQQAAAPPTSQAVPSRSVSGADDLKAQWQLTENYLKVLGFDPGPVDGVVDAATVMAVQAFQKAYGLEVMNQLPAEHFAVLEALAKVKASTESPSARSIEQTQTEPQKTTPGIGRAMSALRASALLTKLGYDQNAHTDDPDKTFYDAVSSFQSDSGLPPTGRLNQETAEKLILATEEFDTQVQVTKRQSDMIRRLRANLIADPSWLSKAAGLAGHTKLQNAQKIAKQLIEPAMSATACLGEVTTVTGFYNAAHEIWTLARVDQDETILDIRLTGNLAPGLGQTPATWTDHLTQGKSLLDSLKLIFSEQMDAFSAHFAGTKCAQGDIQTAGPKLAEIDQTRLQTLDDTVGALSDVHRDQIRTDTISRHRFRDDQGLSFLAASKSKDTDAFDLLTFHTLKVDRSFLLIQTWKFNGQSYSLVYDAYDFLLQRGL